MALQTKDPVFMAGMAKLPQELMDEIIRCSVKKDGVIDIRYLDQEYNLWQVAKKEVFRVNIFRLSIGDTVIGDNAACIRYGKLCFPKFLFSWTTGRISKEYRKILHLEVHTGIVLKRADFTSFVPITGLSEDFLEVIHGFGEQFPRLRTLNFKAYNQGGLSGLGRAPRYYLPGTLALTASDPQWVACVRMERVLRMQQLLLEIGILRHLDLHEKTVEFINCVNPTPAKSFEGHKFQFTTGAQDEREAVHDGNLWAKRRAGFLNYELLGLAKNAFHGDFRFDRVTIEELQEELQTNNAAKDLEMIQGMLQNCGRAVVHYPCGQ